MVIPMCKIKPISPYLKISMQIKNFVKMPKDSNRKCNWHFLLESFPRLKLDFSTQLSEFFKFIA